MKIREIVSDNSFKLSALLTIVFLAIGFACLHFDVVGYDWVVFVILPVSIGIPIGLLPRKKWSSAGMLLALTVFLIFLIVSRLEGFVCVILALPIIVPLLIAGMLIGHWTKRFSQNKGTTDLKILVLPFLFFLFGIPFENNNDEAAALVKVASEIILPYTPEQVYDAIKSVDTLDAEKPFLLKIGLPVPQKCVLEKEEVGGMRTCYFEGGNIVEKITEMERGKILKMDVTEYELTGRKWLGFKEAIYTFEKTEGRQTRMTRTTVYTSALKPRIYWEPLEKSGVEQEHEYVFRNLKKDLERLHGQ